MNIVSWNLNGLPSCLKNGSINELLAYHPDIICLQETRTRAEPVVFDGYRHYWHHSERDKYSGTAVLMCEEPLSVHYGLTEDFDDTEGRAITVELKKFFCSMFMSQIHSRTSTAMPTGGNGTKRCGLMCMSCCMTSPS